MGISERIRQARIAAGLSQTRLANLLGVTRSACSQWESEEGTSPRGKRLAELARLLDVGYEWLATGNHGDSGRDPSDDLPPSHGKALTAQQKQLLILYECLPAAAQSALLRLLESLGTSRDRNNKYSSMSGFQSVGSRSQHKDDNQDADS